MASLGHTGITMTRLDDGKVLAWFANAPEIIESPPDDIFEIMKEDSTYYYSWLTYFEER